MARRRAENDEDVELGEEVQVRRRAGGALVAVRVSSDLLYRIQRYAQARGLTVSEVLRQGAEQVTGQGIVTAYSRTVHTVGTLGFIAGGADSVFTSVIEQTGGTLPNPVSTR